MTMAELKITKLQSDVLTKNFDCGNTTINNLILESYYPTLLQHAYAFEVSSKENTVGYYMINFKKIKLDSCPEDISDYTSTMYDNCTSINIKYISVSSVYQGYGLGSGIMNHIIRNVQNLSKNWPIRLITLDALKEKYEWYKRLGFKPFFNNDDDMDESPTVLMYIDCLIDPVSLHTYCNSGLL